MGSSTGHAHRNTVKIKPTVLPSVMVVSLNPALDQTLKVEGLVPGQLHRVQASSLKAGGKAVNVARALSDASVSVAVTGLFGAENFAPFATLFHDQPLMQDHTCHITGLTRTNLKVVDTRLGETTELNLPGAAFTADLWAALSEKILPLLPTAKWVVLSGSLPEGMPQTAYATLIEQVRTHSLAQVWLDASGLAFREGLKARPDRVKPNRDELSEWAGTPLETNDAVVDAAQRLRDAYDLPCVVASLGALGAYFVSKNHVFWARAPQVHVHSTVGAGDAMVAGLIAAELLGESSAQILDRGMAFAACWLGKAASNP